MNNEWDKRYSIEGYSYGETPNLFLHSNRDEVSVPVYLFTKAISELHNFLLLEKL